MYCMNCGKEISGNIPICGECLQSVLDKHRAEQDILTRVNLEAQSFSIKGDTEEPTAEELKDDTCEESDNSKQTTTMLPEGAEGLPDTPREVKEEKDAVIDTITVIFCIIFLIGLLIVISTVAS